MPSWITRLSQLVSWQRPGRENSPLSMGATAGPATSQLALIPAQAIELGATAGDASSSMALEVGGQSPPITMQATLDPVSASMALVVPGYVTINAATGDADSTLVLSATQADSDWLDFVGNLPGVVMTHEFTSSASVDDYGWGGPDALMTYADSSHADVTGGTVNLLSFMTGCMRVSIPAGGFTGSQFGDRAGEWVKKLREDWPEWWSGYGPGDVFCVQWSQFIPSYYANSRWSHFSGSGGNKHAIVSMWNQAHPTGMQFFRGNASYRDFLQYSWDLSGSSVGLNEDLNSVCRSNDIVYEPAIYHESEATHPAGLNPNDSSLTPCQEFRTQRGGTYGYTPSRGTADAYYNPTIGNPWGSDQRSGSVMLRRDIAGTWLTSIARFQIASAWNLSDGKLEVWESVNCGPYRKTVEEMSLTYQAATQAFSTGGTPTNLYTCPSGSKDPDNYTPDGAWRWNGIWLTAQNTGRMPNTHEHRTTPNGINTDPDGTAEVTTYYGWLANRENGRTIPAPFHYASPLTRVRPSFIPSTPATVENITSVEGSHRTITSAMPAEWQGDDPYNADILYPYSGGIWSEETGRYFACGGGHEDSANNSTMDYDIYGLTAPYGWRRIDGSTVANTLTRSEFNADGKWNSTHTYSGMQHTQDGPAGTGDRIWRFGGYGYGSPALGQRNLLSLDPVSLTYTNYGAPFDTGGASQGFVLEYDRIHKVLLCYSPSDGRYGVFDVMTNSWVTRNATTSTTSGGGQNTGLLCYLGARNDGSQDVRFVMLGYMNTAGNQRVWDFNGVTLSNSQNLTASGSDTTPHSAGEPSVVWDRDNQRLWFILLSNSTNRQYLWEARFSSATNLEYTRHTLTGDSLNHNNAGTALSSTDYPGNGGFRKLGYLRRWGALACVRTRYGEMSIITLPSPYNAETGQRYAT